MLLQLAVDSLSIDEGLTLLDQIHPFIDIIEVGTPMIIESGLEPVRIFHQRYPNCLIMADVKIMDAGSYEAEKCFAAGANIVSVLGVSNDITISGVVDVAQKYKGQVLVDLINVQDFEQRVIELDRLGVDYLCVHTAYDVQPTGISPLDELQRLNFLECRAKSAVAGGVKLDMLPDIIAEGAHIVVVGGGIINHADPVDVARTMHRIIKGIS